MGAAEERDITIPSITDEITPNISMNKVAPSTIAITGNSFHTKMVIVSAQSSLKGFPNGI